MKHLPNIITCFRIACVPVFVLWTLDQEFARAFYLILLLGVSDALDGFLARKYNWKSRLGAWLDPMADKVVLISALLLVYHFALLPLWFLALVMLRDLAVMVRFAIGYRYTDAAFSPHWTGKVSTFLQFVLLLVIFSGQAFIALAIPGWVIMLLIILASITALSSLAIYLNIGFGLLYNETRNGRQYNS